MLVHVKVRKSPAIELERYASAFAGPQIHLSETLKLLQRARNTCVGIADVDFSDLGALARTIIFDIEGNVDRSAKIGRRR